MNLSIITNAVRTIVGIIMKLNGLFDKERAQIKALEKALNSMGKPSYWYQDENPFSSCPTDEGVEVYYLYFDNGSIKIKTLYCDEDGHEKDYHISCLGNMSLGDIDPMLERLPDFLQGYQKFLEEQETGNTITLDKLTKVVEAINSVLA